VDPTDESVGEFSFVGFADFCSKAALKKRGGRGLFLTEVIRSELQRIHQTSLGRSDESVGTALTIDYH